MNLLSEMIKVALSPKKFSELKDDKISLGTAIVYVILSAIAVTIATGMYYYDGLHISQPSLMEVFGITIFSLVLYLILTKSVAYVTKKEDKTITENKVIRIILLPIIFASLVSPILTAITILVFQVDDVMGFLMLGVDFLAVLYAIYLVYSGFAHFAKTNQQTAKIGTVWFVMINMLTGFIVRTIILTMVYGI